MGKASSSKKVARAARAAASSRPGERRNLGFPLVVAAIVIVGVGLVAFARSTREASAAPRIGDHWHASYDVFVCDDYVSEPVLDETDPLGIHTHADGLMHIHPFASPATGENATLSVWFDSFGGSIDESGMTLDADRRFDAGEDCNGEPTVMKVLRYDADDLEASPEVITQDLGDVRFLKNREAFVFALVPEGADLPEPTQGRLDALEGVSPSALTSGIVTTTTAAGEGGGEPSETTVAGDGEPSGSTTTVADEDEASTTTAG